MAVQAMCTGSYNRSLTATIKPAVDFENLEQVFVVIGFVEKVPQSTETEAVQP